MRLRNLTILSQNQDEKLIKHSKLIKTKPFIAGAVTSRGTNPKRQQNQDCSAIITHPNNENLSMMIVVDGKDDIPNSDIVARILIQELCLWFEQLTKIEINTPILLEPMLLGRLRQLNHDLYKNYNDAQASFALVIRGNKETFVANVGNCRVYTAKDNKIVLQTTDNLEWYNYNNPELITPDEVKFLYGKDHISRSIGGSDNFKRHFEPFTRIIENSEYDRVILTTHGVTDVLDSQTINKCIKGNNVESGLSNIISNAIFSEPRPLPAKLYKKFKELGRENMLIEKTLPGESNATVILGKQNSQGKHAKTKKLLKKHKK